MSEEMCPECGDAGWILDTFVDAGGVLIPCPTCMDAGRVIPPKPEMDLDDEEEQMTGLVGWEEV